MNSLGSALPTETVISPWNCLLLTATSSSLPAPDPAPEPEPVPYPPATEAPEYDDEEYDFNLDLRQGAPELPELS